MNFVLLLLFPPAIMSPKLIPSSIQTSSSEGKFSMSSGIQGELDMELNLIKFC